MNSSDFQTLGFMQQMFFDAEPVVIGGSVIAGVVNREPQMQSMEDAGYIDREPATIEVLKGSKGNTDSIWLENTKCQSDLRGYVPAIHGQVTLDGSYRKIMRITNQQDRFLIYTIKTNNISQPTTQ